MSMKLFALICAVLLTVGSAMQKDPQNQKHPKDAITAPTNTLHP